MSMTSTPKSWMDSEFGYEREYIVDDVEDYDEEEYIYNEDEDYYKNCEEEDEEDEEDDTNDP